MSLHLLLRCAGASLVVLALFHAVLWRTFDWGRAIASLSPINARVFVVHLSFIVFVLAALGLLSFTRPDLLLAPSDLGRLLLYGVVAFWLARLVMQPLVFDRAMQATQATRAAWTGSLGVRLGASVLWTCYLAVYAAALLEQLGILERVMP